MSHTSDLTNRRGQWRSRLGRPLIASAAALALVAVSGCGDDEPTSQASTPATSPAETGAVTPAGVKRTIPKDAKEPGKRTLAWAKDVCEAWGEGAAAVTSPDVSSKAAVKQYFEEVSELYGDKQAALEKIGPPPVGGAEGEETWKRLVATLGTLERGVSLIAENPAAKKSTVNSQIAVIQKTRGPIPALRADSALVLAFEQDSCKDIAS